MRDGTPPAAEQAGLRVLDHLDPHPRHQRARDRTDPLHQARAAVITTLWRPAAW
ncbi:hypothetical protein [Nocardia huaxiensis]|uniref:hypothetical protein n=1 Tax=Nocardia huaxiensis TaxID=2755382 RepID=UPI001E4AA460|nr:hypothetical protein [Nocardia huaxiensis]UFS98194.1 hypothetical protein LPY97_10015 [Nocardia huaxiensis]